MVSEAMNFSYLIDKDNSWRKLSCQREQRLSQLLSIAKPLQHKDNAFIRYCTREVKTIVHSFCVSTEFVCALGSLKDLVTRFD